MARQLLKTRDSIAKWLERHKVVAYEIHPDLSVDILKGNLFIKTNRKYLPINFNYVAGSMDISSIGLVSLEGSPQKIGGDFYCDRNALTSLKGAPRIVLGTFGAMHNLLTSLEFSPKYVENFCVNNNAISSLALGPRFVKNIYACGNTNVSTLKGLNTKIGGGLNCEVVSENSPKIEELKAYYHPWGACTIPMSANILQPILEKYALEEKIKPRTLVHNILPAAALKFKL